ncbi:MAG: Fic family protein [Bacillota bacterium]
MPQEFAALFARIDSLKEELDRRRPLTAGEVKRLQDEFLVEFTYSSNAIEGNTLTLRETAMVLEGITVEGKPLKDHLEAVGHRDASRYVQQLVADKTPFSERVVREIHSPEDKGVYRRIPVRIVGARHEPLQPYLVPLQMERLIAEFGEDRRCPIHSATLFHLKFEGVHPFVDGNRRIGRLILNLALMRHGYPPINVKYADRRRYYDCVDTYYRDDNAEPMIGLVAEYVEERLKQYYRDL